MNSSLVKEAAYADKTPYEIWQQQEGIPIIRGHAVEDLATVALAPWKRKGVLGAFINLIGAGRTCDIHVCEIAPKQQSEPQRYLFEQLIYVVQGKGATTVWNDAGRKQTFEWQEG